MRFFTQWYNSTMSWRRGKREIPTPDATRNTDTKRGRRRESEMAGPSAENSFTFSPGSMAPINFSVDWMTQNVILSDNQLRYCSEALKSFKDRLSKPQMVHQEFEVLQAKRIRASDMRKRCTVALDWANSSKNRYTDVIPYDSNRVILKECKDYRPSAKGYINASFVMTSENVSRFIATQGPLPHTSEDFWEMVLQYRCPVIVMLTRLVDNDITVKCGDYYQAEDGPREFGNICTVTKWIKTTDSSIILRCLEVKNKESKNPPLSVLHVQYPEWPDHGVPKNTLAVREIFKQISASPASPGPIVVHCSAGIGRTGTYCVIHNTIQRILNGDLTALDLVNTITTFRSQRNGMVQTLEQYLFCYNAIVDEMENLIAESNSTSSR